MTRTLSVSIPGNIVYVSGTVNGVAVTWTQVGEAWQAIADRSEDDVYALVLTAINASGNSSVITTTLYYGLHLITDRTEADLNRAKYLNALWSSSGWSGTDAELSEWEAGLKGAYNASDLNRVGAACDYVAAKIIDNGYSVTVSPKTNWTMPDIPTQSDMIAYLGNVEAIKNVFQIETPELPESMENLTWGKANDIERVLELVDAAVTRMTLNWWHSGEICAGE